LSIVSNLNYSPELVEDVVYDVCIIGAGAVGIYTASNLIHNNSLAIVEAGDSKYNQELESEFVPSFSNMKYRGATVGRSFRFGGTTSKWSGQLLPFLKFDKHDCDEKTRDSWGHLINICDMYSETVREKILKNNKTSSFENFVHNSASKYYFNRIREKLGFTILTSEWLNPYKRNLTWMLSKAVKNSTKSHLFLNTVASDFTSSNERKENINSIKVVVQGEYFHIRAKKFIICSGAIEGTRSLLNLYENMGYKNDNLGRFLSDHISINIGSISAKDGKKIRSVFNPIFQGSNMRTFRIVRNDEDTRQKYFISFLFRYNENPGFNLLNFFINYFNSRNKIQFKDLRLFKSISGLLKITFSKFFLKRLYIPPNEKIDVLLDFEQSREYDNCIRLINERDSFGNKKANIEWKVSKQDYSKFQKIGEDFVDKWNEEFKDSLIVKADIEYTDIKPYDVYHPVGTCMISNSKTSVVDLDFKVKNIDNIFVINSGVIPSASIANPTFSLFCFSEYVVKKYFKNEK
jgi:hypothetical protein